MGRGRGRNRRTQRKHFKENRENVWKRSKSDPQSPSASADGVDSTNGEGSNKGGWQAFATGNAFFDEYYKGQGIVPPEEWDLFMELLRKPLPAAFRINSSGQFALDIRSQLENDFVNTLKSEFPGEEEAEAIRPLPWYAENLAWHANFSRNQLRKNQTLERFHEFLKLANEIGNITRQEAVSMVPPLFLDVHPEHFVLDMCAAPGSKTFQLLEIIHQSTEPGVLPSGVVVANDVDIQRSNLLIHQTKRMCTANLIVTNHEAQNFPGCNLRKRDFRTANARGPEASAMNQLLFDRVLCDVPCSGDGTLRKAPDMWRKWNTGMGNGVHNLQLLIAMRGISLLKVGGRMVYSTCSMNPVENEAVVAEILRRCEGSVELIDASKELPHLVRRPGLKKWKVCDKGEWLVSYKDVKKLRRVAILPSMFPSGSSAFNNEDDADNHNPDVGDASPTNGNAKSETSIEVRTEDVLSSTNEEVSTHPLERCMRIVPHDMNTGAFFIAVFHKHAAMAGEGSVDASQPKEVAVPSENINGDTKQDFTMANTASFEAGNGESKQSTILDDNTKEQLAESTLDVEKPVETALEDESSKISEPSILDDNHESKTAVAGSEKSGTKRKLQSQGRWKGVDPVLFFKDEAVINLIRNFYGITDSFPLHGHLISRNIDNSHVKRIYYISKSVKDILDLNLLVGHQLKIASCGLKMFERQTSKEGHASPCLFRISSEGLPLILPYITKQILHASAVDFKHLLQYKTIKFGDFIDAEFGEKASQLSMGCCVVVLREDGQSSSDPVKVSSSTIAIGCWKGRTNIAVMVAANECQDLLQRFVARLEAKGISLPEKVISSGSGVNDKESTSNTKVIESNEAAQVDESNEAAQVDEMECAS